MDLFSTFDPVTSAAFAIPFIFMLVLAQSMPFKMFSETVSSMFKGSGLGSIIPLHLGLFISLFLLNASGMIPFWFSMTSHLAVNLSLALPLWFTTVLLSVTFLLPAYVSHLTPKGAPLGLTPMLVIIESVSLCVRPLTLAVRLTANLSTGHIIFGLMASGSFFLCLALGIAYLAFELGVCLVQAYIFTLLPALYSEEHPWILKK